MTGRRFTTNEQHGAGPFAFLGGGFLSDAWPHPPLVLYLPLLMSLTMFLSLGTNAARFAVIPAILGHAVFNSIGTYIGGLFANEPMSAQNVFWRGFGAMMQWLGLGPFQVGPNLVIAACGITIALAAILVTCGRLACPIADERSRDAVAIDG